MKTQAEMVRHIHHKAMGEGVSNIQARLIDPGKPDLPSNADMVFICDVLHHVKDQPAWLKKLQEQMPSGARLVIIEFKTGQLPEGPPEGLKIPREKLVELCENAGFTLSEDKAKVLPYQEFLVFEKK